MISRDRIKKVLNHQEADRIPLDLGSMRSSGIAAIAYNNLKNKMGLNNSLPKMYDFIQQLAYPDEEILKIFSIDVIDAGRAFLNSGHDWKEWTLNDGSKCLIPKYLNIETDEDETVYLLDINNTRLGKKPKTSLYVDQCYWVYGDLDDIPDSFNDEDLDKHVWATPSPPWYLNIFDDKDFEIFRAKIKDLYENSKYAILLSVGANLFETGTFLRGMANFMIDTYASKAKTKKLLDKLVERNIRKLDRILKGVGQYIDVIMFGDDLGGQNGPFMSADVYDEIFKPRHKKMWSFVHDNSNCKVFLHSCGSIYELLPHMIDAGLDIINPVQTSAKDMEPEKLKEEFGKDLVFWGGGCDTRDVLPNKTPKEIEEHVKKRIDIFSKNGGFVFNQVHNVLANIPPENVIAMLKAAIEFGKY